MSAARFQSKLATAQANVSIAHLGTEAQLTETSMAKAHEQRVFEQKKWETQTSFELEKVNLERQRLAIDMMKAQREKAGKPVKQTVITDPSDGKAKWVITDDQLGAEPSATKAKEAAADYGAIDTQIKKAMVARDKLDDPNYGHSIMDNVNSAKREYKAMVNSIAIQTGKTMYGTRQSDKEYERIESLIPFDKWYQKGDNAGIWQNFRENLRSEFDNQMLQHAQAIPGSLQDKTPHNIANPGAAAEYNAKETGAAPVQKFAAAEQAQAVGKDSEDLDETTTGSKLYGHYVKKAGIPVKSGAAGSRANAPVAEGSYSSLSMPGYAVAIDHLATGYADPENIKAWGDKNKLHFGTKNETPDEISQESYKTLLKLASGHINTPEDGKEDVPKEARDYAQYIVSQSKEGLRSLMATDPNKRKDASIDVTGVPNELSLDTRNSSRLQ
jgi:hypothetical protein